MEVTRRNTYIEFFKKNGYLLVKNLFTEEEAESFRKGCRLDKIGDSVCRPEFNNVMLSPKVIDIVKALIGDDLCYPGISETWTRGGLQLYVPRGFHTDVIDDDGDFTVEYPIVNVAIYLQDHINFSNGLKVSPGSHVRPCIKTLTLTEAFKKIVRAVIRGNFADILTILNLHRSVNIRSTGRDLIVWYMRTHHSGRFRRLKWFPNLSLPPVIENLLPAFLCLPDNPQRDVLITKFGRAGPYFDAYVAKQIVKDRRRAHYQNNGCLDNADKKTLAAQVGVTLRNDGYRLTLR
ncbi:hypothetical protein L0Y69_02075 [bacterium]|nr:hypothetical protein [bacterium]